VVGLRVLSNFVGLVAAGAASARTTTDVAEVI
jgi:hypothetical protein